MLTANSTVPTPTVPPSSQADRQHGQLDADADQAQGPPGAAGQAGHQPVAGSGAETGADVHAARQPAGQDPAEHFWNAP